MGTRTIAARRIRVIHRMFALQPGARRQQRESICRRLASLMSRRAAAARVWRKEREGWGRATTAVADSGLRFLVLVCGLVRFLPVRRVLFRLLTVVCGGTGLGCAEAEAKQRREGDDGKAASQSVHNHHVPSAGNALDDSPRLGYERA